MSRKTRQDSDPDPEGPEVVLPVEDHLDLHYFRPGEIARVVCSYLDAALEAGYVEVRLIHGRGSGTLRRTVRAVVARHPDVIHYSDATPERGGWGATVVRLRLPSS